MPDIKNILSNAQIEYYTNFLEKFMDYHGRFGYAVARNYRILSNIGIEYLHRKLSLLRKHGDEILDEDGKPTGGYTMLPDNEYYQETLKELTDLGNIEHEVTIFKITYDDLPEDLSARDIISLEWMID